MNDTHHLQLRGEIWWLRFCRGGETIRISTRQRDLEKAKEVRDAALVGEAHAAARRAILNLALPPEPPEPALAQRIAKAMWKRARTRAKRRGLRFTVSIADVALLLTNSAWRCTISGIPFEVGQDFVRSHGPFKPSLDRIDSRGPYRLDNLRVVCCIANLAMNSWGLAPLHRLAFGITGHATGHKNEFHPLKPVSA